MLFSQFLLSSALVCPSHRSRPATTCRRHWMIAALCGRSATVTRRCEHGARLTGCQTIGVTLTQNPTIFGCKSSSFFTRPHTTNTFSGVAILLILHPTNKRLPNCLDHLILFFPWVLSSHPSAHTFVRSHQALSYDSAYEEKKLWALKAFERYHVKSIYAGADNMAVIAAVIL